MKKVMLMLSLIISTAVFQGCQQEKKSENDKDAAAKRSHKGENAQEVQD